MLSCLWDLFLALRFHNTFGDYRGWSNSPPATSTPPPVCQGWASFPLLAYIWGMFSLVECRLHHSLFIGGFAEGVYGQGLLVMCGVGRQGNLQSHLLIGLLPCLEQMYVVAHRHLRNKWHILVQLVKVKVLIQYTVTTILGSILSTTVVTWQLSTPFLMKNIRCG